MREKFKFHEEVLYRNRRGEFIAGVVVGYEGDRAGRRVR